MHEPPATRSPVAAVAVVVMALAFGGGRPAHAQGEAELIVQRLSDRLHALAGQGRFSGELLISVEGRAVASERFGAVLGRSASTGPDIYPIASVTKTVTAIGILLLAQQGKLALTDSLAKFFPEVGAGKLSREGRAITLDDLLGHRSGLLGMTLFPAEMRQHHERAALRMLDQARLGWRPGERRVYSNEGYVVLGEVIRRVSGKPYDRFVREAITQALGLADTVMVLDEDQRKRLVPGLLGTFVGLKEARSLIPHRLRYDDQYPEASDGGLFATARDLERLLRALFEGRLLRQPWLGKMIEPEAGQSRGLRVTPLADAGPRRVLWHNGATPESGYQSFVGFLPGPSMAVVALADVDGSAVDLTDVVLDAVEGLPPQPVPRWTFSRVMNTAAAVHFGLLMAATGLFGLWWCLGHPRKGRADDVSYAALSAMVVPIGLVEAPSGLFAAGCLAAAAMGALVLRRPAGQPWRWRGPKLWEAVLSVAVAASALGAVLLLRALS
jgi:CubicO group peptidase (beta-lactamase class C family)